MPEPKRLGEFSPEFIKSERELIGQVRTERKGELSDYIAAERPQLKRPEDMPNELDLVRQVMAGRKKEAPVVKERGALGEFAAGFGRGVLGVVAAPAEIADVAGEAMGWEALEKAGEAGAKAVEKYIEESPKLKRTESISKNILKNPELWKDPRWYSSIVGEGLPTILSMVVPGMAAAKAAKVAKLGAKGVRAARIAGGLTAGVGLEAAGAASDVRQYEEQTGEAVPISTKLQSVLGTGIVAGSLEYVPIFAIFGKAGATKLVGRVLSGMALEGSTEGAQGLVANAFAKAGYDADRNMVDGVVESIVGGVLLGGGMGAVSRATNFKERVDETNPDEVSDILEQAEMETEVTPERAVELTEAEKRQAAIDREFEARRTPEERQAEIEAAMPATPMTTISEETTKLAEEGIKPAPVEEVIEPEVVPPVEEVVEEPMPAAMRAMGMRPKKAAVPFMITKKTEADLAGLGYTKDDVSKMTPKDALGIVEGRIAKEPIVEEKIVGPEAPRIEIPTLTDTTQAMAFGEKATPEQITELKRLRKESEKQYHVLVEEVKNDEAIEEAFRGQLYREAFEAKEKPKEPIVEKPKVAEKKPWEMTRAEIDARYEDVTKEDLTPEQILQVEKLYAKETGDRPEMAFSFADYQLDKKTGEVIPSLGTHPIIIELAIKEGKPVPKEILAEYPDLVLAKPTPPKPPKPKPPEAVREEIEAKPIPEVAPKVEKKEKTGFAWIKGKQKPILSARKITSGKNKGKYEVVLTKGRDEEGNIIPGAKKIVTEKHIITMPEEKIEVAPVEKVKVIKPVIPGVKPKVKKEEKIEVAPIPEGKEITVDLTKKEEAAVTPKQQKTYLLAEIDKAIEEAPKVKPFESLVKEFKKKAKHISPQAYTELLEKQKKVGEERVAEYGTVTIHVPDDGVFTILNTKQSFEEFKKKAKKFPAAEPKAKKVIIPGVVRKAPVVETIDELRLTPDGKEYFTDGSVIIKGKPPAGAKYGKKEATQEYIKEILATETKPAELKYYAFMDPDFGEGVARTPIPSGLATPAYSPMAIFQSKSGKLYGYNQFRLNAITKRFPKATYGIAEKEWQQGLLVAYENKKPVAALMPIGTMGKNALMEDMAIEKGFIKAPPLKKEEKPLFLKRKTATAIGVSKATALQKQVDTVTSLWKNAPMVEVIQSQSELPSVILKASKGEIVDGVYYKGKVYIVADNTTSPEAAVKTLLHESFGHYGMRELLGKDFGDIMGKVYIAKRAEVIKIADEYGYDIKSVKDRALAADEWLAREAVSNPESGWVQKVMAAIRQFVRRIMPSLKLSTAEIQKLLEDARTYVERGRPKAEIARTLFEEPGYQVRAFHGGPSMFDKFRTAKIGEGEGNQAIAWGMYFSSQKDIAKGYAEKLTEKGKERYLYQVSLHKGKKPGEYDFLTWDKFITPETKDKVLKQLKKEFPEDAKFMVSWDISYGEKGKGLTGQGLYQQLTQEIANTKNRKAGFEKFRPSDKEASLFLLRAGIDGVKYPAGTITGVKTEGFNYVVFDEEAVSIDERIAFAKRKPVPTKEKKMAEAFKVLGIKPKLKPSEPLPKRARSVGLAYQDISEEAKRLEVEIGLEYPKVAVTHAELREQADRIMGDQEQLLKTMKKEKGFTAEEGLVIDRAATEGLETLMKVVATKDVEKAQKMHKTFKAGIGNKMQDVHSEFGRNLESLKEMVSPMSVAKAFAGIERKLNKEDMNRFNAAAEALGQGDAKPMINFQKYAKATKQDPKLMDYVYEYWYNSILSGWPTQIVNIASNTSWGAWQIGVHKPLLAAIDPLVAKFQKRPTEYYMAEIIPALAGIKRGFKPGIKGAKEMLVKGYTTDADLDKFAADMGKSVGAFSRSPNKYLKAIAPFLTMPTRALRGMDIWAKQMNYEAELGSIAKRMEKKGEGKYEELLKNPTKDMMKEASEYADYTTFMGKLGKIGTQIEKLRTTVPGGRFIMPFVRTIANLVKRGVEMTPGVGAMKLLGGKVKGKEVTQVLVKQIEGAMIALVVASMFDDDEITGDVPANKAEREAFYRQGKKPWSIKVGDTWYQYRRVEPFNTPIAAVGILYDTWKRTGEEPSTEFVYRSAAGFVNNIIDSSYLSGLTQVLDSVRKADKWPQKLTNMFDRTIASFSPMSSFQRSFVRAIEAVDKEGAVLRKPKGAIETLAAATPFISEMVPARKDVWGEEVVIEGSPLAQWLPWKAAKATKDVVEKEIERLHGIGLLAYPGMPAKHMTIAGKRYEFNDDQYDKLITDGGKAAKKKLDGLVGTSYWKMLSDKEKAARIKRIRTDASKKARNAIKRGLGIGAIPGMVPWKTTAKRKRPAWQEPAFGKKNSWQKSIGF